MIFKASVLFVIVAMALRNYPCASEYFRDTSKWSDCYASENVINTVYTRSVLHCASRCRSHSCSVFNSYGETCELVLDESPPSNSSATYRTPLPAQNMTSKEVASRRPVTGSQHYGSSTPSKITDRDHATNYHSIDNGAVLKPHLLVDLQGLRLVEKIRVLPVAGSDAARFRDTQIFLGNTFTAGDFSSYTLVATIDGPIASSQSWMEFDVTPPRCSRYVGLYKYIEHDYPTYLMEVYEVEVMARTY